MGLTLALLAIATNTASAGIFCRSRGRCASQVVALPVQQYAQPTQTIQIQNIYPQGATNFGSGSYSTVGSVSALYATNPALTQQLAADNGRVWAEAFKAAVDSGTITNQAIGRIAEVQAATAHLKAVLGDRQAVQQSNTTTYTQGGPAPASPDRATAPIIESCAKCHGAGKKGPALDFTDPDTRMRSMEVVSGIDVPGPMTGFIDGLGREEKGQFLQAVLKKWRSTK